MAIGSYQTKLGSIYPGLVGWMDAADTATTNITSSGGLVSVIRNKANSQNPFVQATGGNQPQTGVSTMASKNVITFNGTSNYLSCNALAAYFTGNDTPISVFAVYNPTTLTGSPAIWFAANSGNTTILFGHDNGNSNTFRIFKRDDASILAQGVTTTAAASTPVMSSMSYAGSTLKAWKNGTSFYNGSFNVGVTTLNTFALGIRPTSSISNYFSGDIAEILIYNRALSDDQVASIQQYLSTKWRIAL